MYKLTDNLLSEDILAVLDFTDFLSFGGEHYIKGQSPQEKIIKKLNEFYQYHPKTFLAVNKGDYSGLQAIIDRAVEELKFQ